MSSFTRILRKNQGDKRRRTARIHFDRETGELATKLHRTIVTATADGGKEIRVLAHRPSPELRTGGDNWRALAADAVERRKRLTAPPAALPAKHRRGLPDDPRGLNHGAARLLRKLTSARARFHEATRPKDFDPRAYAALARLERLRFVAAPHRVRGATRARWEHELAAVRAALAAAETQVVEHTP